ncbi:hypothetical protein F5Y12DRAFT_796801 [Xylaria sp. FL1777]|nr:hypothetical protein F5Y12DRAFT_796801 [Xylaria sp. FL1777]
MAYSHYAKAHDQPQKHEQQQQPQGMVPYHCEHSFECDLGPDDSISVVFQRQQHGRIALTTVPTATPTSISTTTTPPPSLPSLPQQSLPSLPSPMSPMPRPRSKNRTSVDNKEARTRMPTTCSAYPRSDRTRSADSVMSISDQRQALRGLLSTTNSTIIQDVHNNANTCPRKSPNMLKTPKTPKGQTAPKAPSGLAKEMMVMEAMQQDTTSFSVLESHPNPNLRDENSDINRSGQRKHSQCQPPNICSTNSTPTRKPNLDQRSKVHSVATPQITRGEGGQHNQIFPIATSASTCHGNPYILLPSLSIGGTCIPTPSWNDCGPLDSSSTNTKQSRLVDKYSSCSKTNKEDEQEKEKQEPEAGPSALISPQRMGEKQSGRQGKGRQLSSLSSSTIPPAPAPASTHISTPPPESTIQAPAFLNLDIKELLRRQQRQQFLTPPPPPIPITEPVVHISSARSLFDDGPSMSNITSARSEVEVTQTTHRPQKRSAPALLMVEAAKARAPSPVTRGISEQHIKGKVKIPRERRQEEEQNGILQRQSRTEPHNVSLPPSSLCTTTSGIPPPRFQHFVASGILPVAERLPTGGVPVALPTTETAADAVRAAGGETVLPAAGEVVGVGAAEVLHILHPQSQPQSQDQTPIKPNRAGERPGEEYRHNLKTLQAILDETCALAIQVSGQHAAGQGAFAAAAGMRARELFAAVKGVVAATKAGVGGARKGTRELKMAEREYHNKHEDGDKHGRRKKRTGEDSQEDDCDDDEADDGNHYSNAYLGCEDILLVLVGGFLLHGLDGTIIHSE